MPTKCKICLDIQATFARPGQKPKYCKSCCIGKNMIDVISKKCPCGKQPSFALSNERPTCCKNCKTLDMIDVVSKKCICGKQPIFGLSEGQPTSCKDCKTNDMIDVRNKKCPCGKKPHYSLPGKHPTCCKDCKTSDMIINIKKCICGKQPIFGNQGEHPSCCVVCKLDNMIDVKHDKCPGYNGEPCATLARLYDNNTYCIHCDPDDKRRATRKIDEEAFFKFLRINAINITQRDFRIDYSCKDTVGKYSLIDGIIITSDIVLCLEVDEEAHGGYDPICEKTRLNNASVELRLAFPNHHISWVRINPNILTRDGKRDRTAKGRKVRDQRHEEALDIIKELLVIPKDCIKYIGY